MKQVFISYSSKDRDISYDIVSFLENAGISCFIAPRDIEGGRAYASCLMDALDECHVVLLVASEAINHTEHVLNEVDVMFGKGKAILPLFIEDFEMNADYKYYLGRKQWVIAYPDSIESYYAKIKEAIMPYLPKMVQPIEPERPQQVNDLSKTTVFDYYPDRGIMINPEDHQRNVSFRTDTFVSLMRGIFEKVSDIAGEEEAEKIFYDSGFSGGKNFADRIDSQWGTGYTFDEMRAKLSKWCKFDSAVGWGYFKAELRINEDEDCLCGTVYINETFIVDTKKKRKICAFIRGYCVGVLSTLLDCESVELTCRECPLNSKFKTQCVFDFTAK